MTIDLDHLAALSEAATPGPWKHTAYSVFDSATAQWMGDICDSIGEPILFDKDLALIVAARNALPDLIAALQRPITHEEIWDIELVKAIAAERERCAKICEEYGKGDGAGHPNAPWIIADQIREGGEL